MQDLPPKEVLLDAVARFLDSDLRPAVKHPGLAFRLRVAANLLRVVALECQEEEGHDQAELERLRALFPAQAELEGSGRAAVRAALAELNASLAEQLRAASWDEAGPSREHVVATLRDKLAVVNPRFDLSPEIERRG